MKVRHGALVVAFCTPWMVRYYMVLALGSMYFSDILVRLDVMLCLTSALGGYCFHWL